MTVTQTRRPHFHRLFGWALACVLTSSLVTTALAPARPVAATASLTAPSSSLATVGTWVSVKGSGTLSAGDIVGNGQFTVTATSGVLRIANGATSGLTAPTGYTTAQWTSETATEIAFVGNQSSINNALNNLQFRASARSPQPRVVIVGFELGSGSVAYWPTSGHFYEFVSNGSVISWEAARCRAKYATRTYSSGTSTVTDDRCTGADASRRTLNGLRGYLVNITSYAEHQFLQEKFVNALGWIGGADTTVEREWRWMDGPEKNIQFYSGTWGDATRSTNRAFNTINGQSVWNYFGDGEPNNAGSVEHYAEFGFGSTDDTWNDCQNGCNRTNYIVEYGEDGDVMTNVANASIPMVLAPAAPTGVTASPGTSSATVSWTAVTDNGGASITSYTATSSPGGFTCTTSSTSCSMSGLTPGTAYTFTVTATNGTHTSSSSTASSSITPYTLPGAPTGITATPGTGSVSLSFTAGSTGFTTITNYKYSLDGTTFTALSPADGSSPITVTGLTNNTTYTITLRAVNAAGDSPSSSAVTFRVDSTSPTVTATAQAVNSAGSISARSDETGTLYLVSQTVTVSNVSSITSAADNLWNSSSVATANTDVTISASGLANGTYKVFAVDDNGNLSAASTATMTVDSTPPSVSIAVSPSTVSSSTAQTSTVTFTVSESVTTFTAADVSATFGTLSNFTALSATSYRVTFTPTRSSGGNATITVAAGGITDTAGNSNSVATASIEVTATNGRTTYTSGGTTYVVERFTSAGSSSWVAPRGVSSVDVLVVGGGGGGGSRHGGGGGAGGMLEASGFAVTQGSTYTINVGAGGAGAPGSTGGTGTAGDNSSFVLGGSSIVANGGGPGSSSNVGGSSGGANSNYAAGAAAPGSVNGTALANGASSNGVTAYGNSGGRGASGICGDGDDWCGGGGGGGGGGDDDDDSRAAAATVRGRRRNACIVAAATGTCYCYAQVFFFLDKKQRCCTSQDVVSSAAVAAAARRR